MNCSRKFADEVMQELKKNKQIVLIDKLKAKGYPEEVFFVYQSLGKQVNRYT